MSSVARNRGFNAPCDDYSPLDVFSPSRAVVPENASLSDWNRWRRHLIEIHLSVLHGNILKSLRKSHQSSELHADEFEIVDCDDELPALNDRLVPIPDCTPSEIVKSIKEVCGARVSHVTFLGCDGTSHDA